MKYLYVSVLERSARFYFVEAVFGVYDRISIVKLTRQQDLLQLYLQYSANWSHVWGERRRSVTPIAYAKQL